MLQRAEALTDDFVPGDVVHRHREIEQLAGIVRPVLDGEPAEHGMLFGPSGVGKTCMAKYTLQTIEQTYLGVHTVHIDCWQYHTRRKAIEQLCLGCGRGAILHQELAHDTLLDRVRDVEDPYIVVLDEIDQLDDLTLLRELYGMEGVSIIGIANRERDLYSRVDDWLNTRLRICQTIKPEPYSDDELVAIINRRADQALASGSIRDEQLERIARASDGNAGLAIGALRQAARRAQQRGADRITDDLIEQAIPAAVREERQKSISRLTHDQRVLFEQLPADGSWLRAERLHNAYEAIADEPTGRRNRRNWLSKMNQYNLVEKQGQGRGTEYRRVDVEDTELLTEL